MSSQYNIEPPPKGQCVLHTTSGDIFLELFAQQTPLASRNFLQLILDGYYNNTIFHRLVPGFIIQGGDPTGTGSGGESAYDGGLSFADELHSRLKFNRRGLLGMANGGDKDDNNSQFFLTLGPAEELNGKHTMFGRVAGNTIFNLVRMGEAELVNTNGSERPLYPTKITGADIIENPFEDMRPRVKDLKRFKLEVEGPKKGPRKKLVKNKLSFAADEDDYVSATLPCPKRAKYNTTLVSGTSNMFDAHAPPQPSAKTKKSEAIPQENNRHAPQVVQIISQASVIKPSITQNDGHNEESELRESRPKVSSLDQANAKVAELKASLKRNRASPQTLLHAKKSLLESMVPSTSTRGRKRGTAAVSANEKQDLCAFNSFKEKLGKLGPAKSLSQGNAEEEIATTVAVDAMLSTDGQAPQNSANGNIQQEDEATLCDLHFIANCQSCTKWDDTPDTRAGDVGDGTDWMTHSLSFAKDRLGKDIEWKRKNEEELVVIDPREKAKDIAGKSHQQERSRKLVR